MAFREEKYYHVNSIVVFSYYLLWPVCFSMLMLSSYFLLLCVGTCYLFMFIMSPLSFLKKIKSLALGHFISKERYLYNLVVGVLKSRPMNIYTYTYQPSSFYFPKTIFPHMQDVSGEALENALFWLLFFWVIKCP